MPTTQQNSTNQSGVKPRTVWNGIVQAGLGCCIGSLPTMSRWISSSSSTQLSNASEGAPRGRGGFAEGTYKSSGKRKGCFGGFDGNGCCNSHPKIGRIHVGSSACDCDRHSIADANFAIKPRTVHGPRSEACDHRSACTDGCSLSKFFTFEHSVLNNIVFMTSYFLTLIKASACASCKVRSMSERLSCSISAVPQHILCQS